MHLWPKPILKNLAAPSQYVRVPFMKRVVSQEVVAPAGADDEMLSCYLSHRHFPRSKQRLR
jgi:hypothetical protein